MLTQTIAQKVKSKRT